MDISTASQFLLLPAGALAVTAVARRRGWSAPLLLVVAGLVASFVPGMPGYGLDPEVVLSVFLPPMLYSAALDSSYLRLRAVKQVVGLLAVGLVLFNTVVIGLIAHALIPRLPLAAAFALGAIVAPTDAVSAIAVGRKLGLPRKSITILVGEGLFNDATALTAYRVAVAAAVAGTAADLFGAGAEFLYSAGAGIVIGLAIAYVVAAVLRRLSDSLIANGISLLVPYGAYIAAEAVHASGVISVVIAGIYLGHQMSRTSYGTRILSGAVWKVADLVLESIVFALIGLQVRPIVMGLADENLTRVGVYAVVLFLLAVVLRAVWVPITVYAPRLIRRVREREARAPAWRNVVLTSWAGMRGVVSLAAAFGLPKDFPQRNLVLFLTFAVVIGTLIVQGLSFPWLIRRLGVSNDAERYSDDLAEAAAQQAASAAALARLDELIADGVLDVHEEVVEQLRSRAERTALRGWERLGGGTGLDGAETPSTVYRRLRREMLTAQREVFVRLRDERRIDDEVLHRVMQELDFEEATLERS
ncbi:Na+/H+ antiporter [Planotetraspora mira]|uniref:Na+/H+ antiporter n=1 Tax=Planotetraspora mira TaxID=58121 RepID=A0A8J3X8B2_9ACTN|nr:Na+/H+ antiporter [Planotetraspora mira]GII27318.1 Na+/H+ antiporter [Planotetraspora mira]